MKTETSKNEYEQIMNLIRLSFKHWYYFVISLFICGAIGGAYYYLSVPLMNVSAMVNIRSDESLVNNVAKSSFTSALGLGGSSGNVEDETLKMRSHGNVKAMVKNFNYNVFYSQSEWFGLKKTDLYESSPILLSASEAISDTITRVLNFKVKLTESQAKVKLKLGFKTLGNYTIDSFPATIETDYGSFTFTQSPFFESAKLPMQLRIIFGNNDFATQLWQQSLSVDFEKKTSDIIHLNMNSKNTSQAKKILKELIEVYNRNWFEDKNRVNSRSSEYINGRLMLVAEELDEADREIERFKERNHLTDLQADVTSSMAEKVTLAARIMDYQNQLDLLDMTVDFVQDEKNRHSLIPFDLTIAGSAISQLVIVYNELLVRRNDSESDSPTITGLYDNQIDLMRQNLLKSFSNFREGALVTLKNLKKREAGNLTQMNKMPSLEVEYMNLKREQERLKQLYSLLLQMREETALKAVHLLPKLRIISEPYVINKPVSPSLMKVAMMILFFGAIVFPYSLIYGTPYLRSYFRNRRGK